MCRELFKTKMCRICDCNSTLRFTAMPHKVPPMCTAFQSWPVTNDPASKFPTRQGYVHATRVVYEANQWVSTTCSRCSVRHDATGRRLGEARPWPWISRSRCGRGSTNTRQDDYITLTSLNKRVGACETSRRTFRLSKDVV